MIVKLREEHIPACLEISKIHIGADYLYEKDFLEVIDGKNGFCLVYEDNGEAVGFGISQIFTPEEEKEFLKLPNCEERDLVMGFDKIGILDTFAVSDKCRGRGIGSELVKEALKELDDRGVGVVTAMAWKYFNGHINVQKILEQNNLKPGIEIPGYWNGMVDTPGGHECPVCGAPCKCSAVFYSIVL